MRLAVFTLLALSAQAQDQQLASLQSSLLALRPHHDELPATRDATPALTVVKHQFRDWVESHLNDPSAIHAALRDARLFCEDECVPSYLGFVDDVEIHREHEFLVVQTGVGIRCGYDESAYIYEQSGSGWKRIFSAEQNTYTKEGYQPQTIHAV